MADYIGELYASDTIHGSADDDTINGLGGDDTLYGEGGNDVLIGGLGDDLLYGGSGADIFKYSAREFGLDVIKDFVIGTDKIDLSALNVGSFDALRPFISSDSSGNAVITLGFNSSYERITLTGISASQLTVDSFIFNSNPADLTVEGTTYGYDYLFGGNGNDTLNGYGGGDTLSGGAGADTMRGNVGDDRYYVDNAGDSVIELADQGTDAVNSTITYTLGANLENLVLAGASAINGAGNTLANTITGNAANNALSGLAGNDRLIGGAGNDTLNGGVGVDRMEGGVGNDIYYVDSASDLVIEANSTGIDAVYASSSFNLGAQFVENLTLTGSAAINATGGSLANILAGNAANNILSGLAGNDRLIGNAGNDKLLGGLSNDTLAGGAGNDIFVFNTRPNTSSNRDSVTDFANASGNNDIFHLENAVFTKLAAGALSSANFKLGAAAGDANDYVIYNKATGILSYDADGNGSGAAVQIAVLTNKMALTVSDFFVI